MIAVYLAHPYGGDENNVEDAKQCEGCIRNVVEADFSDNYARKPEGSCSMA